jgi:LCP family protein required for cell wall assembly
MAAQPKQPALPEEPEANEIGLSRSWMNTLRVTRVLAAVLSLAVFCGTWYGWAEIQHADNGLTRSDVIDSGAGDSGPQNILMVGIDTRRDAQGNPVPADVLNQLHAGTASDGADGTDTMIVVHIPAGGGKAIAFSVPRDSYVRTAGGYGMHKINSAYTYAETAAMQKLQGQGVSGSQLWLQAAQAGAKNSIQTVEQLTGLKINHYAAVNLVGFDDISQAIGGVTVCLKQPSQDSYSGANFPAGVQTIQGAQALAFVRQRHGLLLGDVDRERRQQVFLAAAAKSLIQNGVLTSPTKLNSLVGAIQKSITLDQNWDLLGFAQQMQGITGGNIQFYTIPIENMNYQTPTDGESIEVDPTQVQQFIDQHTGAQPPGNAPPPPSSSSGDGSSSANSGVTVDVDNANGASGLANQVMSALTSKGFTQGSTSTVSARQSTVIEYASGEQSAAQSVDQALGGGMTTSEDSSLTSGHVKVVLGAAYSGPGASSSSGSSSHSSSSSNSSSSQDALTLPTQEGSGGGSNTQNTPITASGTPCID